MIQLCRHILAGNRRCGEPALHGTKFCRHHRGVRNWKRGLRSQIRSQTGIQTYDHGTILVPGAPGPDSRTWESQAHLELEFPEDSAAILTNIYRVTSLLVQGQIDRPTANSVTYGMQVCLSALNGKSLFEPAAPASARSNSDDDSEDGGCPTSRGHVGSRPVHRVILTPDGDEIAPPAEILEDGEAEPIHHKGCPCMACAEKYRNHPPELHHPECACGLCEPQDSEPSTDPGAPSLTKSNVGNEDAGCPTQAPVLGLSRRSGSATLIPDPCTLSPELTRSKVGHEDSGCPIQAPVLGLSGRSGSAALIPDPCTLSPELTRSNVENEALIPDPCALSPQQKPRIAHASSLLSASPSRDPLNRPWSVAEYTFGDAIRRHEAQHAARAAACLKVGIEPPPYLPYTTGLIPPGHPDYKEEQQMQQHSSEYWAEHFRKQIAERPDIQKYLEEEAAAESAGKSDN